MQQMEPRHFNLLEANIVDFEATSSGRPIVYLPQRSELPRLSQDSRLLIASPFMFAHGSSFA
jgi:hypothetical protein